MEVNRQPQMDSIAAFKAFNFCWKVLGHPITNKGVIGGPLDWLITIIVTIGYPLHLIIGLFMCETKAQFFEDLVMVLGIFPSAIKLLCYRLKRKEIQNTKLIMSEIDKRVKDPDECRYFQDVLLRRANVIVRIFAIFYTFTVTMSIMQYAVSGQRRLLYPGWFPFDWKKSTLNYSCAVIYQIIGLEVELVQTLANDVYPTLSLCLLADHVHILRLRLSTLGCDPNKSDAQYNDDLNGCVRDFRNLMRLFKSIDDTISPAIFVQLVASGVAIGIAVIFMVYYVDNIISGMAQYFIFIAFLAQVFPSCYFGTIVVSEIDDIPYAIFSGNWIERQPSYRKKIVIFLEQTMPMKKLFAARMIGVHVNTFFSICKIGYTCFAVMSHMK